jgi:hypothetical protein
MTSMALYEKAIIRTLDSDDKLIDDLVSHLFFRHFVVYYFTNLIQILDVQIKQPSLKMQTTTNRFIYE